MDSNTMPNTPYLMSFTSGGLYSRESAAIVELYVTIKDWESVKKTAITSNVLQTRTVSTSKRVCGEICSRLKELSDEEIDILVDGTPQEKIQMLWIAVCRRYQFIHDFAVEVVRERFISLRMDVSYDDYDTFFNDKAEWHEELERLSDRSRIQLRRIVYNMLRECEIITEKDVINPIMLTPLVVQAISETNRSDLAVFPISDLDIQGLTV